MALNRESDRQMSYLIIGSYCSMKLTRIVKIRVNLSHVNFVER